MMLVAHALVPALSDVVASQVSKLRVESDSAHLNTLCDFIDDDDDDFALTVAEGSGALSTNRLAAHCAIQATGTILQTDNGTLRFTGHVSGTLHFNPHSSVPIQRLRRVDWDLETKERVHMYSTLLLATLVLPQRSQSKVAFASVRAPITATTNENGDVTTTTKWTAK
ncbi:hypothetical protein IAT40_005816 [Kwoniella sp. CBS 6097]